MTYNDIDTVWTPFPLSPPTISSVVLVSSVMFITAVISVFVSVDSDVNTEVDVIASSVVGGDVMVSVNEEYIVFVVSVCNGLYFHHTPLW